MVASDVRLTRTFDETNIGRAFVIGTDRDEYGNGSRCVSASREEVSATGERKEKDLDIGRLSRPDSGRCAPVRPLLNRTEDDAKVVHTRTGT